MGRLGKKSVVFWSLRESVLVAGALQPTEGWDMSCVKVRRQRLLVQRRNWKPAGTKLPSIHLSYQDFSNPGQGPTHQGSSRSADRKHWSLTQRQPRRKREGQEPVCVLSTARKQNGREEREAAVSQEGKSPKAAAGRMGRALEGARQAEKKGYVFIYITQLKP